MAAMLGRSVLRRAMRGGHTIAPLLRREQTRGLAEKTPYVSYSQWRSGEATYMQFQNANRPYYVIAVWGIIAGIVMSSTRKGKKGAAEAAPDEEKPDAAAEADGEKKE